MPFASLESASTVHTLVWQDRPLRLHEALERMPRTLRGSTLVLDCRNLRTLRSEDLSALIQLRRHLQARECGVCLDRVPAASVEVLQLTRLDRLFEIRPETEADQRPR